MIEGWLAAPEPPSDPIDVAVLSRDPAVGEAYAADPLVWHGGWKRPTLEAFVAADRAIAEGPGFGDLPLLYVHGAEDQLVPLALARPVIERVAGPDSEFHVLDGARHEVLNELGKERDHRAWWPASPSASPRAERAGRGRLRTDAARERGRQALAVRAERARRVDRGERGPDLAEERREGRRRGLARDVQRL